MGKPGQKCVRCGEITLEVDKDYFPTCPACKVRIEMESGERRKCLSDGSEMEKVRLQNIVIDRCPACGGVWLDSDEIEKIGKVMKKKDGAGDFASGFLLGMLLG